MERIVAFVRVALNFASSSSCVSLGIAGAAGLVSCEDAAETAINNAATTR